MRSSGPQSSERRSSERQPSERQSPQHVSSQHALGEDETLDVVTFGLNGERYGVRAKDVEQVVRAVRIVPLPGAPDVVEGVIDVRGDVLPVFDLRRRFGLEPRALRASERMVIAHAGQRRVVFRCEPEVQLLPIPDSALEPAERVTRGPLPVAGVAKLEDGLVLVHDLERFLDEAEAVRLDEAMAAAEAPGGVPRGEPDDE